MTIPDTEEALTELFTRLGASDPQGWAQSQLQEGIPQLHRYLWLRQAWKFIVAEDDTGWMNAHMRHAAVRPDDPYTGVGHALRRCLAQGVDLGLLNDIVRGMQVELLAGLSYMLEDPDFSEPELAELGWGLFATDAQGHPMQAIPGLHESVLELDPTGRSMRPRQPS